MEGEGSRVAQVKSSDHIATTNMQATADGARLSSLQRNLLTARALKNRYGSNPFQQSSRLHALRDAEHALEQWMEGRSRVPVDS